MQLTIDPAANPIAQIDAEFDLSKSLEKSIGQGRLNNFLSSVSAYADMSPDLSIRREVNHWMIRRDRQSLNLSDWCTLFGHGTPTPVLTFIYENFGEYSGLDFSRVSPNDSLNTNLHFPLVCWFDWTITFCEEFFQAFDVDLSDRFDEADFTTIGELVNFLTQQVETAKPTAETTAV